jgi:hypothetical protein
MTPSEVSDAFHAYMAEFNLPNHPVTISFTDKVVAPMSVVFKP